jgi:hypothetical protein
VVTDTWVSMHDSQSAKERRHNQLRPYQVNEALMAHAKPDALFMHCLPAHRDEEATNAVMDGPHSVIFDEAENRLHAQKAILRWCADASFVTPFTYLTLVFAALYDATLFGVLPDGTSLFGALVIISGAALLAWRESVNRQPNR